jgi:hypothetical protein
MPLLEIFGGADCGADWPDYARCLSGRGTHVVSCMVYAHQHVALVCYCQAALDRRVA